MATFNFFFFQIGRVGMGMTTLLTVTAMFGSVRQNVPRVSYVSYLDIWMLMCILFVFFCVLEFTVVTTLLRGNRRYTVKTLEYSSRIAVPIIFVIFNIIYWPSLFAT